MSRQDGFPIHEEIEVWQGTKWSRYFWFVRSDGTAYDTTGWTARMHVRTEPESPTILLELTTENGRLATGQTKTVGAVTYTGGVLISIPATDLTAANGITGGLVAGYDLEIIPPSGEADAEKVAYGRFTVNGEYTR